MKSAIFSFIALILGVLIAYMSYSASHLTEIPVDLADELFTQYDIAFLNEGVVVAENRSPIQILSIGDADSIIFPSTQQAPTVKEGKIHISKGVYLIGLSDPFHEYTLEHTDFSIEHVANGTYVVDTTGNEPRIYSLTAFLRVSILEGEKVRTKVDVFPSEHFVFDPGLGENYDGIDVFRVGQIARLELLNYRNKEDAIKLGSSSDQIVQLIKEYEKFLNNRTIAATEIVKKLSGREDEGLVLLEKYGSFFINDTKRKVILKNSLIGLAQGVIQHDTGLCTDTCLKTETQVLEHTKKVKERLDSLMALDSVAGEKAKKIVRRYISLASMISTDREVDYYTKGGSILVSVYQDVFQKSGTKGAYRLLTELYSQYYFPRDKETPLSTIQSHLEKSLKDYVVYLVNTKSMKEEEFIGFVYFLKEFLTANREINGVTVELFSQIVSISGSYIATIDDPDMRFQGLSVVYYTFSTIANRLYENIYATYFTIRDEKFYLKPEYVSGAEPNLPQGLVSAIDKSLKAFDVFNSTYGEFFVASLNAENSNIIDSKSLSESAFVAIRQMYAIVTDYQAYLVKSSVKEGGTSTLEAREREMHTPETVKKYFSQFKGMDTDSFTIVNDPKEEGFYRISAIVDGRKFRFAFLPESTVMREIIFIDIDNTLNQIFRSQTINLDQKKKTWAMSSRNAGGSGDAKRFDFAYFFQNTFYPSEQNTPDQGSTDTKPREEMSPEMKRFVNSELLKKDFTYVEEVLPLGISNVYAKIEDGSYVINIFNANMQAVTQKLSYSLRVSSDYVYNSTTNAFKDMRAKIYITSGPKDPIFGGIDVQILPEIIRVDEFSNKVSGLGELVNFARSRYIEGTKSVVIDLDSNRIGIDGTYYVLPTK